MDAVNLLAHKGRFFKVPQETPGSQTAVMTIMPGEDAGPEETHEEVQILYISKGKPLSG